MSAKVQKHSAIAAGDWNEFVSAGKVYELPVYSFGNGDYVYITYGDGPATGTVTYSGVFSGYGTVSFTNGDG
jgi:hypothetical protein